ncbi:MAG: hypothetical protein WC744_00060 [Patescibacteria group bacterium]|jgi:hypothetical protein
MLTQDDLQAIGKIIEVKLSSLEAKLTNRVDSLEDNLTNRADSFETRLTKKIGALDNKTNRRFKSVDRKLNVIINYFDHQDIDIRKRLNRIELHLGLVTLNS